MAGNAVNQACVSSFDPMRKGIPTVITFSSILVFEGREVRHKLTCG